MDGKRYTGAVMEQEDFNAFEWYDTAGAILFLGLVPAALNFAFNDHDLVWTGLILSIAVAAALVVSAVQYFTHWRSIGVVVNYAAWGLVILYAVLMYTLWPRWDEATASQKKEEQKTEAVLPS